MNWTRRDFVRGVAAGVATQVVLADARAQRSVAAATTRAPSTGAATSRPSDGSVDIRWLDGRPAATTGTTFGVSWPKGTRAADSGFSIASESGEGLPSQSWPLAFWPDGSLKWTAHAIGSTAVDNLIVRPSDSRTPQEASLVRETQDRIEIDTGVMQCAIPRSGEHLITEVSRSGRPALTKVRLVALRDDSPATAEEGTVRRQSFASRVDKVTVEQGGPIRAVVRLDGMHTGHDRSWLPFTIRLYFYAGSDAIRVMHTFVFDGDEKSDFIRGLGLRFDVPMSDLPHDRHVRFGGKDRGLWGEAVRNLSGLRRDPGKAFTEAQFAGQKCPPQSDMAAAVRDRLDVVPMWDGFSLTQLSADAFTISKRTAGDEVCAITAGHGERANGLGYIGGPGGGVAFGLRDFWQRHPTELELRGASTDTATATVWLWSPHAPAMDLRFYHDGMGMKTHDEELRGLDITYEDYEAGFGTPFGVARTNELMLWALPATPSRDALADLGETLATPGMLVCTPEHYHASGVFAGKLWSLPNPTTPLAKAIEATLAWFVDFYAGQIEQRRWYGFWDHGDVIHTYDSTRHAWRYDVGGYGWANSELSPDLWLWYSFLRTGDATTFRLAEAMTRHTGEVDVYHLGRFRRLGTRHGVLHWGDSAKQLRISTAAYRRFYYFLSGGDERVGDLMRELLDADETFVTLDPIRKIRKEAYEPKPEALAVGFGTDWGSLAAAWLAEWERTNDPKWRDRLRNSMETIGAVPLGFFGTATYDLATGKFTGKQREGDVSISHLSSVFGLPETVTELIELIDVPAFRHVWLEYCTWYNADRKERARALGFDVKSGGLTSAHARLTAIAADAKDDASLAKRAWDEFFVDDRRWAPQRYTNEVTRIEGPNVLTPVDEAAWVSTNDASQWSLTAMQCLALIGDQAPTDVPDALRPAK